jgi:hypothetical protein
MLDPLLYRSNETLAKSLIPHWRVAQTHNLDHFERVGFPVRVSSMRDLGQIVDSMQENRFQPYMDELGGLTADEHALVLETCRDAVEFQLTYLPHRPPVLPISTLLASFALYRKMLGIMPNFRSVLEIGPGCGYLSFFLKRHSPLENYSQIEACESFYLLQNLVNLHCFGSRFDERALPPEGIDAVDFFVNPAAEMEFAPQVRLGRNRARCTHYPWWRIGELISRDMRFDFVTSNANLLEFNTTALDDYLTLIQRVLDPSGMMVVQCTGWPSNGNDESLLDRLYKRGFAPLFYVTNAEPTRFPGAGSRGLLGRLTERGLDAVPLVVTNALLVKAGHPLFTQYNDLKNYHIRFVAPEEAVRRAYFDRPPNRHFHTAQQFVEQTERAFDS